MEVIIQESAEQACKLGAALVARLVRSRAHAVIGFATGSTPLPMYRDLVRRHQEDGLSFAGVTSFNLDEYVGLDPQHPASFTAFMKENVFRGLDFSPGSTHIPDGQAVDLAVECAEYERKIVAAGGIDLQILGIGEDGHLAFNEPSSSLASRTRLKTLTAVTRKANAGPFGGEENVPRHVLTMGLGTIMAARMCLMLAFGGKKADAVRQAVEGPVSAACPASILQFHEKAVVLLDREAAAGLSRGAYYQEVFAGKPAWQRWDTA